MYMFMYMDVCVVFTQKTLKIFQEKVLGNKFLYTAIHKNLAKFGMGMISNLFPKMMKN